ncbi:DUF2868 domain-containing protein [Candidatus Sumerlaeota bacterium]|nr:DUF2868 domain-containing protein [Candidatus Sumerlaeota bacterium]
MTRTSTSRATDLAALIDFEAIFEQDRALDRQTLRKRDRETGLRIADRGLDRREALLVWLDERRKTPEAAPGQWTTQGLRSATAILFVLGLLSGSAAAAGLLYYDGAHPINIIPWLGVFVALQLLLLLLSALLMLPRFVARRIPGMTMLQRTLAALSPGRWLGLLGRLLPGKQRNALRNVIGRAATLDALYGELRNRLLLTLAQVFGSAFHLAAIVMLLMLAAFTDLAFAWSTTLQIKPERFQGMIETVAAPWFAWAPGAVPSFDVIENTQYYRLQNSAAPSKLSGASAGQWWPFLLMCAVVYGLLPRIALLAVCGLGTRYSTRHAPLDHAGFQRVYERMTEALIDARSPDPEAAGENHPSHQTKQKAPLDNELGPLTIINWCGAGLDAKNLKQLDHPVSLRPVRRVLEAGAPDIAADRATLDAVRNDKQDGALLFAVKSYESPTRDCLNFIAELRKAAGPRRSIILLPVHFENDAFIPPGDAEFSDWETHALETGDPWLRCERVENGGAS